MIAPHQAVTDLLAQILPGGEPEGPETIAVSIHTSGVAFVPKAVERVMERWRRDARPGQPGVRWPRDAWLAAFPNQAVVLGQLPVLLDRTTVERATSRLPETKAGVLSAFVLSTAWGYGGNGYGPYRAARILSAAGPAAAARLQTATRAVRREGPLAGYRALGRPDGSNTSALPSERSFSSFSRRDTIAP